MSSFERCQAPQVLKFRCSVRRQYHAEAISEFFSLPRQYTLFFISNTFTSNARLKLAKNQANAEQHPEAEILLFENYSVFIHVII